MSYVDTTLINCNRLASVESRSGNDSNTAVFTNTLQETIKLDVGDKITVERAFINEVGVGNPQTIEFKGQSKGRNPVAPYTNIQYGDYYYNKSNTYDAKYRLGYYRNITTTEVDDDVVDLKDNLAPLVFGYYITSNEYPNYVQQPRRFITNRDARGSIFRDYPDAYTTGDSVSEGLPLGHLTINTNCVCFADWSKRITGSTIFYKQKVDNTRYTLFIKDKIAYSGDADAGLSNNNYFEQFPDNYHNGIFQEGIYYRIRDKLEINVNSGFNTPSAIANQITQQLTETKKEQVFEILDGTDFVRPITKTIETNTYKPINAQNIYNVNQLTYTAYTNQVLPATAGNVSQDSIDYIATFGYIGVKRPEIFEMGRRMHAKLNNPVSMPDIYDNGGNLIAEALDDFEGFSTIGDRPVLAAQTENEDTFFTLNVLYNETNLGYIRDFFDSQALYPELWDNLQDTVYYSDTNVSGLTRPTIDNSRFFHFNKYTTSALANIHNETFGDDAFTQRASPNDIEMSSVPVFFKYDDSKRNTFVEPKDFISTFKSGLSYGAFYPVEFTNYDSDGNNPETIYLIGILCDGISGVPRDLFSEDTTPVDPNYKSIEQGRRFGYDFHSTAYSTAIITPYSGYCNTDIGVEAVVEHDSGGHNNEYFQYATQINHIRGTGDLTDLTDFSPYMTMCYIGANNPGITYNTTTNRFELSRFHTGNNIGNKNSAGNPSSIVNNEGSIPPDSTNERGIAPPDINQDAGQTVYKINPRPPQFGFSPTFKPYNRNNQAYRVQPYPKTPSDWISDFNNEGVNTIRYDGMNSNIEPYKIFDSHGGIYIENWGFDQDNWEDSLWDILGFDYNAVNAPASSKNVLTKRVDNENSGALYRPTTNAEVVQTDTKNYVTNQFSAVQYYTSLPYPTCVPQYKAIHNSGVKGFVYAGASDFTGFVVANASPLELWNQVDVLTQSTTISATDIQKSVLRPYYTIRSNILEGATAIGGNPTGANLPIISIVDKYSGASDYFLGNPSNIQFTVTKPTIISDITTSIHDSDGEYANVDKTSAVIYKIEKVKITPTDLIQDILSGKKKK